MKPIVMTMPTFPFDYTVLMNRLQGYKSPRAKVTRMLREQELIRIKKGLYIRGPDWGDPVDRCVLGNLVYGPSYISFEYALSYYSLIPERVEAITCATNKRNRSFSTPVGYFSYRYLNKKVYSLGITRMPSGSSGFLIAMPEKALCDMLSTISGITRQSEIPALLFEDLRIDIDELATMDKDRLQGIAAAYSQKTVRCFAGWFQKTLGKELI